MSNNNDNMLPIGCILKGVYRVERYLSAGKFSKTYIATNVNSGKEVVVKEFFIYGITQRDSNSTIVNVSNSDSRTLFQEQMLKFRKEAMKLCRLESQHIVLVHDLFEENGTAYYVMDYINGESLADKLKRIRKPLPETVVLEYLTQILDALACMHQRGLLHLDLNPANIMVNRIDNVTLIGFGAWKQHRTLGSTTTSIPVSYTNGFVPREQMEQNLEKIGPWTDFYALGATLYNLLTNKKPPSPSIIDKDDSVDKHFALPMPSNVSFKTIRLVLRLMTIDFRIRPRSVLEISEYIDGFEDSLCSMRNEALSAKKENYRDEQERIQRMREEQERIQRKREEAKRKLLSEKMMEIAPAPPPLASEPEPAPLAPAPFAPSICVTSDEKDSIIIPSRELAGDPTCIPTYMPKSTITTKKGIWTRLFNKSHYDNVFSSIFAPAETRCGAHLLIQVYLHLHEETENVNKLASETDEKALRRDYIPLHCKLKKGDTIDVILSIFGEKLLMSQKHTLSWQGSFTKCSFDYLVPKEIDTDELSCMAVLAVNGAQVGEMRFITRIVKNLILEKHHPEVFSRQYQKIFISYAHQDEDKVKMIAIAYNAQGVDYFFDRHYLKPGDIFPIKIKEYINSADRFILCWSANAAKSDYVRLELKYALERAFPKVKPLEKAPLSIYPMSIEPRADKLPEEMKDIYNFDIV